MSFGETGLVTVIFFVTLLIYITWIIGVKMIQRVNIEK